VMASVASLDITVSSSILAMDCRHKFLLSADNPREKW